jgi:hypothetical protein
MHCEIIKKERALAEREEGKFKVTSRDYQPGLSSFLCISCGPFVRQTDDDDPTHTHAHTRQASPVVVVVAVE